MTAVPTSRASSGIDGCQHNCGLRFTGRLDNTSSIQEVTRNYPRGNHWMPVESFCFPSEDSSRRCTSGPRAVWKLLDLSSTAFRSRCGPSSDTRLFPSLPHDQPGGRMGPTSFLAPNPWRNVRTDRRHNILGLLVSKLPKTMDARQLFKARFH